jgi:hypothetical protein
VKKNMTHEEIEQREVIESYVRGRLTMEERLAFEEHYFICDRCFAEVQTQERFVAGVHYAAEAGLLAPASRTAAARKLFNPDWQIWLKPAFAFTSVLALALTFLSGWLLLRQLPQLRDEQARERQAHEQAQQEQRQNLAQTQAELERARQRQSELETQLAQARASTPTGPEPNLPLVMLEATRAGQAANELALPKGSQNIVLWIEPGVGADFDRFRLTLQTAAGQPVETVEGLRRNAYGALVVSLPAARFSNTRAQAKLYGLRGGQATLVAEYRLQVRKR